MSKLPSMPRKDKIYKSEQMSFGGLRHYENCSDGEIYDMSNMICDKYPILVTRSERERIPPVGEGVTQIYADNGAILSVWQSAITYNGIELVHGIRDREKAYFVRFGNRVVLMPDKLLLNLTYRILGFASEDSFPTDPEEGDCYAVPDIEGYKLRVWNGTEWADAGYFAERIEYSIANAAASFGNGTSYGKEAKANSICFEALSTLSVNVPGGLKEGDAVTIEGCSVDQRNNKTVIIREIGEDESGNLILRFSENCFFMPESEAGTAVESFREENITVKRTMPDMDILFEHGNRLWGAKGKELFASKIGDPRNWNCYDGLSTDSWYLATQGKGEFTAGISYGYPRFFKEGSMLKVYGSIPSAFQTSEQLILGVKEGENRSLTHCHNLLFWLSPKGMVIYNGGSASLQEQVFGDWELQNVVACGDVRYAFFGADIGPHPIAEGERAYAVFRYDTERQLWSKEESHGFLRSLSFDGGLLYGLYDGGEIEVFNGAESGNRKKREEPFSSYVEFGDFTDGQTNQKGLSRLNIRLAVERDSWVELWIRYDSEGEWRRLRRMEHCGKSVTTIPVIPRRCDHYRIRFEGYGAWKLFSIARERSIGSAKS
ncbi:MAG: hypothetical protein J6K89_07785 [Oscillospiraceae bacterium]|nr:hypothetical protein [Oscillospiraceae bacterium]